MVAGSITDRHYEFRVDSTSNTNEYQKYFLRSKGGLVVGLTTLQPFEIWKPQLPGSLRRVQVCTEIPLSSLFIFPFHSGLLKVDKRDQHKSTSATRMCCETITTVISVNLCRSFGSFLSFKFWCGDFPRGLHMFYLAFSCSLNPPYSLLAGRSRLTN